MKIKVVVFELDDTIFSTELGLLKSFMMLGDKMEVDTDYNKIVAVKEKNYLDIADSILGEQVPEELEKYYMREYAKYTKSWPGVKDLFKRLDRQGYQIAILDNNHSKMLDYLLEEFGIKKYVSRVYGYDTVKKDKPDEKLIKEIGSDFNVGPGEMVFVTNNQKHRKIGKKAGVRSIVIKRPESEFETLYQRLI